ncbi:MAG: UDP-N-acetylglucosamine acyltransferase [Planctomycetota bacterium]|jgi:UDP-N-acetylglucosamine acyltransferase
MATKIHSTAVVADTAQLGIGVEIGPYSVIGGEVTIGDGTRVGAQVVIDGVTEIGADNIIVGQAALGGAPQDFSYKGEKTRLIVGDRNTIREFVTINRGTVKGGGVTKVGSDSLFMACSHVAHDCELQNNVILGNNVMLAGHCLIERNANISGAAGAHHFVTVGAFAYVGGMTRMVKDVPPYTIVEGYGGRIRGINVVGMQRAGLPDTEIEEMRSLFKRIFRASVPRGRVLDELKKEDPRPDAQQHLIDSLMRTELGMKGRFRESLREQFTQLGVQLIIENGD